MQSMMSGSLHWVIQRPVLQALQRGSTFGFQLVRHINIFWHSWHIFDHSFWHILSELLASISSDILSDLSCDILQLLLWHTLSATTTNPFHHSWGPARHTELAWSQLGSGTPHWTRRIAVEVRHTTLNSRDHSWGPARHTELAGSRLGSGTPHWTRRIAVGVQHATLNSQYRDRRRRRKEEEAGGGEGEETNIKSNNPHLTGGEIWNHHLETELGITLWFGRFLGSLAPYSGREIDHP